MSTIYTFKHDSEIEQKVQQVERLMTDLGLSVAYTYDGLTVSYKGKSYPFIDSENKDTIVVFPREFDGQKILHHRGDE